MLIDLTESIANRIRGLADEAVRPILASNEVNRIAQVRKGEEMREGKDGVGLDTSNNIEHNT